MNVTQETTERLYHWWSTYTDDGWYDKSPYAIDDIYWELQARHRGGNEFLKDKDISV